jgi:hypothetical protein
LNEHARGELSGRLRRVALAIAASGVVAAATVHADPGEAMKAPQLKSVQGLTLQGPYVPVARDIPVVDTVSSYDLNRVFDVKQVRAERLPAVESIHQLMIIPPN